MKRFAGIMIIVFMAMALAVPASAQRYGRVMTRGMKPGLAMRHAVFAKLRETRSNLTTEQREAIRKARYAFIDETAGVRSDIQKKRAEFIELLKSDNPNKSEVMAIRQELIDLKTILFQKKFELRQRQREIIHSKNIEG
jgi:Spy/CpxP family protein refolding chaperone